MSPHSLTPTELTGRRLRFVREQLGLSRQALADQAPKGSLSTIQRWEEKGSNPQAPQREALLATIERLGGSRQFIEFGVGPPMLDPNHPGNAAWRAEHPEDAVEPKVVIDDRDEDIVRLATETSRLANAISALQMDIVKSLHRRR